MSYYIYWAIMIASIIGLVVAPSMKNYKKGAVLSITSLIVFLLSLKAVLQAI